MEYTFKSKKMKVSRGFTLVEILVSIALFGFVMLATTSTLLSLVDANHKAQSNKTAIDNLSLTLESMTRNIRTGSVYLASGDTCSSGSGNTGIRFIDHKNQVTTYSWDTVNKNITKTVEGGIPLIMTSPEISIDGLCYYIEGNGVGDNIQPIVLITAGGVVNNLIAGGAKQKTGSRFDIQTLVSQRLLDK